jgi:hypothetical protein
LKPEEMAATLPAPKPATSPKRGFMLSETPFGRTGTQDEIAKVVVLLRNRCCLSTDLGLHNNVAKANCCRRNARRIDSPQSARFVLESLGDVIPIDDLEPGSHVFRPPSLVLQIISVLPNVYSQQRFLAFAYG